jgi:hypothetical protein
MKVLTWNLEWASIRSARGREISRLIASHEPDVMCLTELTLGYPGPANRRKVAIWSSAPWTEPELIGHPDFPSGRFVSGVTHGIRFVGVCIPWHTSNVSNGRKDRKLWEDHLSCLHLLRPIIDRKRLILARLKKRVSEFRCVRFRDTKSFSREPARGVAA